MGPLCFSQELAACLIKAGVFIRRKSGPQPPVESSAQRFWENSTEGALKNTLGTFSASLSEIPPRPLSCCQNERGDPRPLTVGETSDECG